MAAKFATLAAILITALALALSSASPFRTTTTISEEENPRAQSCAEQMQMEKQQLRHCMMHMQSEQQSPFRMTVTINPQQQHQRQCCQAMENMDRQCRCEAVRMMVKQQMEEGEMQSEEMQQMMQEAKYLPLLSVIFNPSNVKSKPLDRV